MKDPEEADAHRVSDDPFQYPIAEIPPSHAVAVYHQRSSARDLDFFTFPQDFYTDPLAQESATPGVVVATQETNPHTRFPELGQRREHAIVLRLDDTPVLEPEVEQVPVDQELRGVHDDMSQKAPKGALGRLGNSAEMYVGNNVGWPILHWGAKLRGLRGSDNTRATPIAFVTGDCVHPLTARMEPTTTIEARVRYAETDQMGVVYHANYFVWCEIARTELIRRRLVSYAELERQGVFLAVTEASIRYHAPARYDDLIRVTTWLTEVRSRTVVFAYRIERVKENADLDRLATASTTLVALGPDSKPRKMPSELVRALTDDLHV